MEEIIQAKLIKKRLLLITKFLRIRKRGKQKLISSSSTILIFEIFLQTIKENLWRKQLSVGNTKSNYKGIIAMKEQTS